MFFKLGALHLNSPAHFPVDAGRANRLVGCHFLKDPFVRWFFFRRRHSLMESLRTIIATSSHRIRLRTIIATLVFSAFNISTKRTKNNHQQTMSRLLQLFAFLVVLVVQVASASEGSSSTSVIRDEVSEIEKKESNGNIIWKKRNLHRNTAINLQHVVPSHSNPTIIYTLFFSNRYKHNSHRQHRMLTPSTLATTTTTTKTAPCKEYLTNPKFLLALISISKI